LNKHTSLFPISLDRIAHYQPNPINYNGQRKRLKKLCEKAISQRFQTNFTVTMYILIAKLNG